MTRVRDAAVDSIIGPTFEHELNPVSNLSTARLMLVAQQCQSGGYLRLPLPRPRIQANGDERPATGRRLP
jgi:hypothetical protein